MAIVTDSSNAMYVSAIAAINRAEPIVGSNKFEAAIFAGSSGGNHY